MERPVAGDVVVIPFPFSNLSDAKRRPALVLATAGPEDVILCQITSQQRSDPHSIALSDDDFESGGLRRRSNIRPSKLFTASRQILLYSAGRVRQEKRREVLDKLIGILRGE